MHPAPAATSILFVPGSRPDRFDRALQSGAGLVILDLEDSVADCAKIAARQDVLDCLVRNRAGVRVNGTATGWAEDDLAAVAPAAAAVMIPKAQAGPELTSICAALMRAGAPVIALIETAAGVQHACDVARTPGVARLAFGSLDLAAELGLDPLDHEALAHARWALVLASSAAGLPAPLDGVWPNVRDHDGLRAETTRARRLGFGGKLCVHPDHVPVVEAAFAPTAAELSWAQSTLAAYEHRRAAGVFNHDGMMIDKPVVARARTIMARSAAI